VRFAVFLRQKFLLIIIKPHQNQNQLAFPNQVGFVGVSASLSVNNKPLYASIKKQIKIYIIAFYQDTRAFGLTSSILTLLVYLPHADDHK
jgi:hypothetical protein